MVSGHGQGPEQGMLPTLAPAYPTARAPSPPLPHPHPPTTARTLSSLPGEPSHLLPLLPPTPFIAPTAWNLLGSHSPRERPTPQPGPGLCTTSNLTSAYSVNTCPTFKSPHFCICSSLSQNVLLTS